MLEGAAAACSDLIWGKEWLNNINILLALLWSLIMELFGVSVTWI